MKQHGGWRAWVRVFGAVAVLATTASAQKSWVRFDNGVTTSPDVTFGFDRPTTVFGSFGETFAPGEPRFAPPTLLCGRATSQSLMSGLSVNAIAAGDSGTGLPVWVVTTSTFQRLSIHLGDDSVDRAFRDGNWSGVYVMPMRDEDKAGTSNLLVLQTGANGGSANTPDFAFAPTNGGSVHNGLIVAPCEVLEPVDGEWVSSRAALAYTTIDRLQRSSPWIIAAMGVPTNELDTARGSPWSYSAFPVSDDEFVAVWTDYRTPVKTGGIAYATRFLRDGDGVWSASTIRVARSESPVVTEHWHCGGYIKHPDGRASIVVSVGDGIADNYMLARTKSPGFAWASETAIPDTGIDERSRVYEPAASWSDVATVWGGVGTEPCLRHNQVISMIAADTDCSRLLCGTDETGAAVLSMTYDPDTKVPAWRTLYLPSATSWPSDGVLNFSMQGEPGGPYLGRIDAASTSPWQAGQRETRILYSPDGEIWGQCLVAGTTGSRQGVIRGDVGYIGSLANEAAGFRRIDEPTARVIRPMMLSPSTDNLLRETISKPTSGFDLGVDIVRLNEPGDLPEGVPLPPCEPGNIFKIENRSEGGRMGLWYPVSHFSDAPRARSFALLRAWVYALGPESDNDPATTAQLTMRFSDETRERLDVRSGRLDFDSGAWTPFTIWGPWTAMGHTGIPDTYWRPVVELRAEVRADRRTLPVPHRVGGRVRRRPDGAGARARPARCRVGRAGGGGGARRRRRMDDAAGGHGPRRSVGQPGRGVGSGRDKDRHLAPAAPVLDRDRRRCRTDQCSGRPEGRGHPAPRAGRVQQPRSAPRPHHLLAAGQPGGVRGPFPRGQDEPGLHHRRLRPEAHGACRDGRAEQRDARSGRDVVARRRGHAHGDRGRRTLGGLRLPAVALPGRPQQRRRRGHARCDPVPQRVGERVGVGRLQPRR
ncbi:MAG: hypothetical protein HND58_02635 [Planctomycetota bacterium]|nr:MAG: hypothetical protein HND58_02635 [Planctomycetota bacterium]